MCKEGASVNVVFRDANGQSVREKTFEMDEPANTCADGTHPTAEVRPSNFQFGDGFWVVLAHFGDAGCAARPGYNAMLKTAAHAPIPAGCKRTTEVENVTVQHFGAASDLRIRNETRQRFIMVSLLPLDQLFQGSTGLFQRTYDAGDGRTLGARPLGPNVASRGVLFGENVSIKKYGYALSTVAACPVP